MECGFELYYSAFMLNDLFADEVTEQIIDLCLSDGQAYLYVNFLDVLQAEQLFNVLLQQLDWSQQHIKVYGKNYAVPRLSAWYADNAKSYEYSGLRLQGLTWTPELLAIKSKLEKFCQQSFNSLLANLYRDGADGVGWHADDEIELGQNPFIASLSLGQERVFQLKHRRAKNLKQSLVLPAGSLLVMSGATQHHWLHQLPKSRKPMKSRINLTFRQLI